MLQTTLTDEQRAHRPLLVGRSDAVADPARPLDLHRACRSSTADRCPIETTRRCAGPARHRACRCLHRLLARQVRIRPVRARSPISASTIDPKWEPLLITPPFPEYPSGHSTQSGAAAAVLTAAFGEDFAFEDRTHEADGLPVRTFPELLGGGATRPAVAALRRHPFPQRHRAAAWSRARCIGAYADRI